MKNKSEKLARNAIRARKAKNKRANEQDKPKKGKRWLIRLGALMGCLLLVSALVVPCFAQLIPDVENESSQIIQDVFYMYQSANVSQPGYAVPLLIDMFSDNEQEMSQFLSHYYLLSGSLSAVGNSLFPDYNFGFTDSAGDDGYHMYFDISTPNKVDMVITYGPYYDRTSVRYENTTIFYEFDVLYNQTYDDYVHSAFVRVRSTEVPNTWDYFRYQSAPGDIDLYLTSVTIGGVQLTDDEMSDVTYAILFQDENDLPIISAISYLFNGDIDSEQELYYYLNYPSYFLSTFNVVLRDDDYGYEAGYDYGLEIGDARGYERGFRYGYDEGYDVGSSGEFGKNMLGESFSAPINALKQFEIVSWTTTNGRTVTITIMTVVSALIAMGLFFLFIKMFAGG